MQSYIMSRTIVGSSPSPLPDLCVVCNAEQVRLASLTTYGPSCGYPSNSIQLAASKSNSFVISTGMQN